MKLRYTADIGLEVHAELQTKSKMFCDCPVVDLLDTPPNTAVCPICGGMPGTLPVVNAQAVAYALRVALALDCTIAETSRFARKNYFYPDLPKGYQISQYEFPLAEHGVLPMHINEGWIDVRIRRVHLEEDTAKLTHIQEENGESFSLIDLNRAGIPLLEIVSEPDMHTVDEVRAYTHALRQLLQYLEVNSGDLERGAIRFEANVSIRPVASAKLGTRVEIKNLNSFKSMTGAIEYELERQAVLLASGGDVAQETLGWDEIEGITRAQRSKEEAHDYRYFPEPDLPPLVIQPVQITAERSSLPERPDQRIRRLMTDFSLNFYQAEVLTKEKAIADYFEATLTHMQKPDAFMAANWIIGELFGLMNTHHQTIAEVRISAQSLATLLEYLQRDAINNATAKLVMSEMFSSGERPEDIIHKQGLAQISDRKVLEEVIEEVLAAHTQEWEAFLGGKTTLKTWFFGQVMQHTAGQANPTVVQELLEKRLTKT
ncbi:MAG: Asp-tRNA(Asn)/Glu-tRNA(Gln) amidotransferase subunit GatB [Anaerolineales bacterium]